MVDAVDKKNEMIKNSLKWLKSLIVQNEIKPKNYVNKSKLHMSKGKANN